MLPATLAGLTMGFTAMVGVGAATVMMDTFWIRAYCRHCKTRSFMPEEEYKANKKCPNCGTPYWSSDVRRTKQVPKDIVEKRKLPVEAMPIGIETPAAPSHSVDQEVLQALQLRLAKGEITREQYRETLKTLAE